MVGEKLTAKQLLEKYNLPENTAEAFLIKRDRKTTHWKQDFLYMELLDLSSQYRQVRITYRDLAKKATFTDEHEPENSWAPSVSEIHRLIQQLIELDLILVLDMNRKGTLFLVK